MAGDNVLFFGDNLAILRKPEYFPDASADLIYLDPPFSSGRDYNVLFTETNGKDSGAQKEAFTDTWHWDMAAASAFDDAVRSGGPGVAAAMEAFKTLLGESDMMAYLSMMAPRLVELRRVLRPTGSIYLHCDPTASHYLKLLMDSVFGPANFRNEIIWQRSTGKANQTVRLPTNHDIILAYGNGGATFWNHAASFQAYDPENLDEKTASKYTHHDADGRVYRLDSLISPNPDRPNLIYEFLGVTKVWRWTKERMLKAYEDGLVVQTGKGKVPQFKRYLESSKGRPLGDVWTDIPPLNSQAQERLGYPTQKPEALLERIIELSSPRGGTVLDPFCGCGTTIAAAQGLGRRWVGIDITYLAIGLVERRLKAAFGPEVAKGWTVIGQPTTVTEATALASRDRYQFQWWVLDCLDAWSRDNARKKGADQGIDGLINFQESPGGKVRTILIQVKSGGVHRGDVATLSGDMSREGAAIGALVTLEPTTEPMRKEAASAGFYEPEDPIGAGGPKYPKIQLLSIADILEGGRKIEFPEKGNVTFRQAPPAPKVQTGRVKQLTEATPAEPTTSPTLKQDRTE
ncbi:MAG: DNA methyltransferase [Thermoplasmata archaeon]